MNEEERVRVLSLITETKEAMERVQLVIDLGVAIMRAIRPLAEIINSPELKDACDLFIREAVGDENEEE